jgi:exodeoxyribonuclease-5
LHYFQETNVTNENITEKPFVMSPDQTEARDMLCKFVKSGEQEFGMGGAAGTGKTTVLKASLTAAGLRPANIGAIFKSLSEFEEPEFQHGRYLAAACTRRAAGNMIRRGVPGARTIHSICCNPLLNRSQEDAKLMKQLEEERDQLNKDFDTVPEGSEPSKEIIKKLHKIEEQLEKLEMPDFEFSPTILNAVEYLVIDEASMVEFDMLEKIRSSGIKIIRIGDPFQLPPIDVERRTPRDTFFLGDLNVTLLKVHRQSGNGGSDVLNVATALRNGEPLRYGDYGKVKVKHPDQFARDMRADNGALIVNTDFFITDTNERRQSLNRSVRKHIFGLENVPNDWHLRENDKITIRKNSAEHDLSNGDVVRINELEFDQELNCYMIKSYTVLETDEFREKPFWVYSKTFNKTYDALPVVGRKGLAAEKGITILPADYGYAMTCHSAQGSEQSIVTVRAQLHFLKDPKLQMRWVYTALTRAKEYAYIYAPEIDGIKEWQTL